jgi:hypothetical protein
MTIRKGSNYYERHFFHLSPLKTLLEPYRTVATILNWL